MNTPYYFLTQDIGGYTIFLGKIIFLRGEFLSRSYEDAGVIGTLNGEERPEDSTQISAGLEYLKSLESGKDLRFILEYSGVYSLASELNEEDLFFKMIYMWVLNTCLITKKETQFDFGFITDISSGVDESIYLLGLESRS